MSDNTFPLTVESKALIKQLLEEHYAAKSRLDVAVMATKAAMNVPMEYDIKDLDVGFQGVTNGGNN